MEFDEKCYIIAHVTAVVVMGINNPCSGSKGQKIQTRILGLDGA